MHGQLVVGILGVNAGSVEDGAKAGEPLRTLGERLADLMGPMSYTAMQSLLDPLCTAGAQNYVTGALLGGLTDETIDTLLAWHAAGRAPVRELHLHHCGGAMARVPADSSERNGREDHPSDRGQRTVAGQVCVTPRTWTRRRRGRQPPAERHQPLLAGVAGRARLPDHRWLDPIQRSALAIKALTYTPTGATVAALTPPACDPMEPHLRFRLPGPAPAGCGRRRAPRRQAQTACRCITHFAWGS